MFVDDGLFPRLVALLFNDGGVLTLPRHFLDNRRAVVVAMVGANCYARTEGTYPNPDMRIVCEAGAARASPAAATKAIANFIMYSSSYY